MFKRYKEAIHRSDTIIKLYCNRYDNRYSTEGIVKFMLGHLTFSPVSLETFRFASMSHLLPSNIRLTPADAFWERGKAVN